MRQDFLLILGIAFSIALFTNPASAEHEADHRYSVRGYVLEGDETPVSDVDVVVRVDDGPVARTRTDGEGYYTVRLHLHDRDIGRKLTVRAGDGVADIRMSATRGDRSSNRVHHVNFIGDNAVEGELEGLRFPAWVKTATAVLAGLLAVTLIAFRTRRHLRRKQARSAASDQGRGPKKQRRRRKRKRR